MPFIPDVNDNIQADFSFTQKPGYSHRLDFKNKCIVGYLDGLEAYRQAVFMILNSERTQYEIYSWNFGIEAKRLQGRPVELVEAWGERAITDALMQDDRTVFVGDFKWTHSKSKSHVLFTAECAEGEIETGWDFRV